MSKNMLSCKRYINTCIKSTLKTFNQNRHWFFSCYSVSFCSSASIRLQNFSVCSKNSGWSNSGSIRRPGSPSSCLPFFFIPHDVAMVFGSFALHRSLLFCKDKLSTRLGLWGSAAALRIEGASAVKQITSVAIEINFSAQVEKFLFRMEIIPEIISCVHKNHLYLQIKDYVLWMSSLTIYPPKKWLSSFNWIFSTF